MEKTKDLTMKDLIEVFKDYMYFMGQLQDIQNRFKTAKDALASLEKELSDMEKKTYEKEQQFLSISKGL